MQCRDVTHDGAGQAVEAGVAVRLARGTDCDEGGLSARHTRHSRQAIQRLAEDGFVAPFMEQLHVRCRSSPPTAMNRFQPG